MSKTKRRILHFMITLCLIGAGAAGFLILTASKPELKRGKPPAPKPLVRVMTVETGDQLVVIRGEGTVRPMREIQLVPEVNGKIIYISPALVDGGEFKKGDVLLRIDPVDYQLAVTLAKARVKDSESKLRVAEEEAAAAKEEWRLLEKWGSDVDKEPPALVAKEPQLAAARARLEADRADLRKARLNLERTEIKAPFNGRVGAENVDIGQYAGIAQNLATLFSTDAAQIVVPFEDESLYWFHVPGFTPGSQPGSEVRVRTRFAGRQSEWKGRVMRAEGKLDERSRMVDVVIRVENPYASRPPLVAGLFVAVEIQGRTLENAAVIPREALREDNTVWVVDESGKLTFRPVEIARLTTTSAILKGGLASGEMLVLTSLKAVTDGMQVRVVESSEQGIDS
jgi:RND family efflux transporter MFP subunit